MPLPRDPFWDVDIPRVPSIINEFTKQMVRLTDAEIMRDGYKLERDEAAKLFLKARDRAMKAERERDSCKVSISIWTTSRDYWKSRAEKAERERDKLAAALKRIKTMPYKTENRVYEVIDAALDGVEE